MWGRGDFFVRMRSGGGISGLTGWNWAAMASKAPPFLGWWSPSAWWSAVGAASAGRTASAPALEKADADETGEMRPWLSSVCALSPLGSMRVLRTWEALETWLFAAALSLW